MKDIVIFKGTGAYDVMAYFSEKLCEAFLEEGIEAEIIDLVNFDSVSFEKELKVKIPKLCIGFNSMSFNFNNKSYYKYFGLKHLAIMVDHPIYHIPLIDLNYKDIYIGCNDIGRVNFLKNDIKVNNAFVLMLATDKKIEYCSENKDKDIVFFGTMVDYEAIRNSWNIKFGKPINKILNDAIEIGMYNSFMPLHEILNIALIYNGHQNIGDADKIKFQLVLLPEIDKYLRFFNRVKFIQNIKKQKIEIYGNDVWNKYLNTDNITIYPSVNIEDSLDILKRSKISLNATMTLVYNGITERVLNSAMCGSVIFSNHSPFLESIFKDSALLTDIKDMNNIDESLGEILSSDKKRIIMADSARDIVYKNHTWNSRVKDIMGLI